MDQTDFFSSLLHQYHCHHHQDHQTSLGCVTISSYCSLPLLPLLVPQPPQLDANLALLTPRLVYQEPWQVQH